MKIPFFILALITLARTTFIDTYDGNCAGCIYSGYNYCNVNGTCIDNFPDWCTTIYDTLFLCPTTTCPTLIIDSTAISSQMEA